MRSSSTTSTGAPGNHQGHDDHEEHEEHEEHEGTDYGNTESGRLETLHRLLPASLGTAWADSRARIASHRVKSKCSVLPALVSLVFSCPSCSSCSSCSQRAMNREVSSESPILQSRRHHGVGLQPGRAVLLGGVRLPARRGVRRASRTNPRILRCRSAGRHLQVILQQPIDLGRERELADVGRQIVSGLQLHA